MINYLTEEEQYKRDINNDEIARIKDSRLQTIRMKYWNLKHQAFLNEQQIPDHELEKVIDNLDADEQQEILEYRKSIGKIGN